MATERERILAEVRAAGAEDAFAHRLLWAMTGESVTPYSSAIEVDTYGEWDGPAVVLALLEATDEQIRSAWESPRQEAAHG